MRTRRILGIMMVLVIMGSLATEVLAQPGQRPERREENKSNRLRSMPHRWGQDPQDTVQMMMRALRQLDLTDEQTEKIREIHKASQESLDNAREAYELALQALNQAATPGADEKSIRTAATKVGTALGDMMVLRSQITAKMRGVLTPEQIKKLDSLKEEAQERRQQRAEQARKRIRERLEDIDKDKENIERER
jgi:Spy/CpxP family protein refolding chaperone